MKTRSWTVPVLASLLLIASLASCEKKDTGRAPPPTGQGGTPAPAHPDNPRAPSSQHAGINTACGMAQRCGHVYPNSGDWGDWVWLRYGEGDASCPIWYLQSLSYRIVSLEESAPTDRPATAIARGPDSAPTDPPAQGMIALAPDRPWTIDLDTDPLTSAPPPAKRRLLALLQDGWAYLRGRKPLGQIGGVTTASDSTSYIMQRETAGGATTYRVILLYPLLEQMEQDPAACRAVASVSMIGSGYKTVAVLRLDANAASSLKMAEYAEWHGSPVPGNIQMFPLVRGDPATLALQTTVDCVLDQARDRWGATNPCAASPAPTPSPVPSPCECAVRSAVSPNELRRRTP